MPSTPLPGSYTPTISPQENLPRRVVPRMEGNPIGPALSNLAETEQQIIVAKERADGATYAGNQLSDLRVRTMQAIQKAKETAPENGDGFVDGVLKAYDDDAAQLSKAAKTNHFASNIVDAGIRQFRETVAEHAITYQAQVHGAWEVASIGKNIDKTAGVVEADPSQRDGAAAPISEQIRASRMSPQARLEMHQKLDATLDLAAAKGLATQNPRSVLDALKDPESAPSVIQNLTEQQREVLQAHAGDQLVRQTGDGVVNTYRQLGPTLGAKAYTAAVNSLPPDLQDAGRQHIIEGLKQYRAQAREQNANQIIPLEEGIGSGHPPTNARGQLISLYNKGVYSPEDVAAKFATLDKLAEKESVDDAHIEFADRAYRAQVPLDPESKDVKDGVDGLFLRYAQGQQPGSDEWTNRAADIAYRTGVAPDTAVSWARANLVSGNVQNAVTAANVLARLNEATPRGSGFAVDEKTRSMAAQIVDITKAGGSPEDAVAVARKNATLTEPERQSLEAKWRSVMPEKTALSSSVVAITSGLANDPRFAPGWFTGVPKPNDALAAEYQSAMHDYFMYNGGDLKQAEAMAADAVRRTWGVTEVNGERELMPYAPETMFPGIKTADIRADLEKGFPGSSDVDKAKIRLVPTDETTRTNGLVWSVAAPDKNGAYNVVIDKDGRPMRYQIPVDGHVGEEERQKQAAAAIEQARKLRDLERAKWKAQIDGIDQTQRMLHY